MIDLREIGRSVAAARRERHLKQLELAQRAGVSRPTIDMLENGRAAELGYSKLIRILAVLGLELRLQTIAPERPTLDDLLKESVDD